jgi:hypothetical protein
LLYNIGSHEDPHEFLTKVLFENLPLFKNLFVYEWFLKRKCIKCKNTHVGNNGTSVENTFIPLQTANISNEIVNFFFEKR